MTAQVFFANFIHQEKEAILPKKPYLDKPQYYNSNIFDFRKRLYEFRPYIHHLIIRDDNEQEYPMVTQVFLDEVSAEKMKWIGIFLNQQGKPLDMVITRKTQYYSFMLAKEISGFPIFEFARNFRIDRIVNRKIETMNLQLLSSSRCFPEEEYFEDFVLQQQSSKILVGSCDPETRIAKDQRVIAIAAHVFVDFSLH